MNARIKGRREPCTKSNANKKLEDARIFSDLAQMMSEESHASYRRAAASLAVTGGIAASDAACCHRLGERSRSQDHRDAAALLESMGPDGKKMSRNLKTLLDLKDKAQYGFGEVSVAEVKASRRALDALIEIAEKIRAT